MRTLPPFSYNFLIKSILPLLFFLKLTIFTYSQEGNKNRFLDSINQQNVNAYNLQYTNIDSALTLNLSLYVLLETYPLETYQDSMTLSNLQSVTGGLYQRMGLYSESISNFIDCLKIREQLGDKNKLGIIQVNIANTYHLLQQNEQAISYGKKAIQNLLDGSSNTQSVMNAYNTLGVCYMEIDLDSAIYYFDLSWDLITPEDGSIGEYHLDLLSNLGNVYEYRRDMAKAMHYHLMADSIQQLIGDKQGLVWTRLHIGLVQAFENKFTEAQNSFDGAYQLALEQSDLLNLVEISEAYTRLYLSWDKPGKAYDWFILNDSLRDELTQQKIAKSIAEKEAEYNVKQKEAELAKSEAKRKQIRVQNYALLGLLIAGLIVFVLLFRGYRQKQYISQIELDLKEQQLKELESEQEKAAYIARLEGQERERQRIARDLHDRLGNTMAALRLSIQQPPANSDLRLELVDLAVSEIKSISYNLSSAILKRYGLNAALRELKKLAEHAGTLSVHLYLTEQTTVISEESALELYRIIQELTSNALKHAEANEITLQTTLVDDRFNLIFEDNGKGFVLSEVQSGMGIQNIHTRTQKLNGTCSYDTQPHRGTIVIIDIPTSSTT